MKHSRALFMPGNTQRIHPRRTMRHLPVIGFHSTATAVSIFISAASLNGGALENMTRCDRYNAANLHHPSDLRTQVHCHRYRCRALVPLARTVVLHLYIERFVKESGHTGTSTSVTISVGTPLFIMLILISQERESYAAPKKTLRDAHCRDWIQGSWPYTMGHNTRQGEYRGQYAVGSRSWDDSPITSHDQSIFCLPSTAFARARSRALVSPFFGFEGGASTLSSSLTPPGRWPAR